jgi:AcrR family transcriptional regulator
MTTHARPSLRERKFAKTRLALAEAASHHLEAASFETLSVKSLCERVQISEATFFNYFPKKEDLIVYLDRLWTLELNWYGHQAMQQHQGLAVIDALGEIIAHEARSRTRHRGPEITVAERMLAFSDLDGIVDTPDDSLEGLLRGSLQTAIEQGELPENITMPAAMVGLVSIFYGVPLALQHSNPAAIAAMYRQQLELLWKGLRAAAG